MNGRRVVVTGASGFVGSRVLAPLLRRGYSVHALGRREPALSDVAFHEVDLFDRARVAAVLRELRPTHLLHAAWFVGHGQFWTAPDNDAWQAATLDLARQALQAGVQRFVGLGSCAEYDWTDGGAWPRSESDRILPATRYGRSKAATGRSLQALCASAPMGLAWARLFHLYGPGEPCGKLVSAVLSATLAGTPALLGPGHLARDFMSVLDAGEALAALVDSPLQGPVNLASGTCTTVARLATLLGELTGRPDLIRLGALPLQASDVPRMAADVRRMHDALGFKAAVPLAEGLARMVRAAKGAHGQALALPDPVMPCASTFA
jgi:nucleoside-diphosphate-sugar epimerase